MEKKKIRIGIIGFGMIARSTHLAGYRLCQEDAEITAVCDIKESALKQAADMLSLTPDRLFTDYRDLMTSGLVDAVDICVPNYLHCQIASAAVDYGLPFSVEKPLGMNTREAAELIEKAERAGIPSFCCFTWRFKAYVRYVKDMIDQGELGSTVYHLYIKCLKDSGLWEGRKLEWRFDREKAGSGVLGDLGSHMVDVTRFFGEEFEGVYAQTGIFVHERQREDSDDIAPVTTDDWCNVNGISKNGVPITINISRCNTGVSYLIEFLFYGENGSIRYCIEGGRGQVIEVCLGEDVKTKTYRTVTPPEEFEDCQSQSFVNMLRGIEDRYTSHLNEGYECQKVLDAALLSSQTGRYVSIKEIEDSIR